MAKKKKKYARKPKSGIEKEIQDVENWVHGRRKFLIKLGWVAGLIIVLLIVSRLYLRVKGFG